MPVGRPRDAFVVINQVCRKCLPIPNEHESTWILSKIFVQKDGTCSWTFNILLQTLRTVIVKNKKFHVDLRFERTVLFHFYSRVNVGKQTVFDSNFSFGPLERRTTVGRIDFTNICSRIFNFQSFRSFYKYILIFIFFNIFGSLGEYETSTEFCERLFKDLGKVTIKCACLVFEWNNRAK